ncbi:MAG: hypothetical protein OEN23_08190 [Paracoccaceae bacterium]|nr:hypothetical protein [Paracoccaceae bacterium]
MQKRGSGRVHLPSGSRSRWAGAFNISGDIGQRLLCGLSGHSLYDPRVSSSDPKRPFTLVVQNGGYADKPAVWANYLMSALIAVAAFEIFSGNAPPARVPKSIHASEKELASQQEFWVLLKIIRIRELPSQWLRALPSSQQNQNDSWSII